ncbi:HLH domain containing protein [Oryctes borbonicus]|uniref:HLH domain containing protein n=1 Tax=Oryctes borbonicus TaxID=1629725 RepID=A0A0T6BD87_9SCAR|nr:HLH domain containing protein [Oryctes borbonicus]
MTNGITKTVFVKGKDMDHITRFCPAVDEDFPEEIHSPTDSSEDSVEVKVEAISIRNKRKCAEPRRVHEGPLKKRMCLQTHVQPFRPWSRESAIKTEEPSPSPIYLNAVSAIGTMVHPLTCQDPLVKVQEVPHAYFRPPSPIKRSPSPPSEPVALVKRKDKSNEMNCDSDTKVNVKIENDIHCRVPIIETSTTTSSIENLRVPLHPQVTHMTPLDTERMLRTSADAFPRLQQTRKEQRNYKNMTRERRIEANARERTRVHTISAAFDTLRRAIPAYSHSQKLSKLSVLRVACSYIMTLSNMLQDDQSELRDCVDQVTKTIQREGKLRKKKDESD